MVKIKNNWGWGVQTGVWVGWQGGGEVGGGHTQPAVSNPYRPLNLSNPHAHPPQSRQTPPPQCAITDGAILGSLIFALESC